MYPTPNFVPVKGYRDGYLELCCDELGDEAHAPSFSVVPTNGSTAAGLETSSKEVLELHIGQS